MVTYTVKAIMALSAGQVVVAVAVGRWLLLLLLELARIPHLHLFRPVVPAATRAVGVVRAGQV